LTTLITVNKNKTLSECDTDTQLKYAEENEKLRRGSETDSHQDCTKDGSHKQQVMVTKRLRRRKRDEQNSDKNLDKQLDSGNNSDSAENVSLEFSFQEPFVTEQEYLDDENFRPMYIRILVKIHSSARSKRITRLFYLQLYLLENQKFIRLALPMSRKSCKYRQSQ
jgi:hypothetical protein